MRDITDAKMLVPYDGWNGQRGNADRGQKGDIGRFQPKLAPSSLGRLEEEERHRSQFTILRDAIADCGGADVWLRHETRVRASSVCRQGPG